MSIVFFFTNNLIQVDLKIGVVKLMKYAKDPAILRDHYDVLPSAFAICGSKSYVLLVADNHHALPAFQSRNLIMS